MRLFVAIDIDDATRAELTAARQAMRPILDAARVRPRVTWIKDDAAHLTLRFIGNVAEPIAARLQETLTAGFPMAPFDVAFGGLGTFPERGAPRVIWLGVTEGAGALVALAREVTARVDPLVSPADDRPLMPHLTIARVKDPGRGVEWQRVLAAPRVRPTRVRVDHVTLYLSRTLPEGATYTALGQGLLGR